MRISKRAVILVASVALLVSACGGNGDVASNDDPEGFQTNLAKSIAAAEKGKQILGPSTAQVR